MQVIVVDVRALGRKDGREHRKLVVDRALKTGDQDNEAFYRSLRARFDRSGFFLKRERGTAEEQPDPCLPVDDMRRCSSCLNEHAAVKEHAAVMGTPQE